MLSILHKPQEWQNNETKKLQKNKRLLDKQLRANATFAERAKERTELAACNEELDKEREEGRRRDALHKLEVDRLKQKLQSQQDRMEELERELELSEQLRMDAEDKILALEKEKRATGSKTAANNASHASRNRVSGTGPSHGFGSVSIGPARIDDEDTAHNPHGEDANCDGRELLDGLQEDIAATAVPVPPASVGPRRPEGGDSQAISGGGGSRGGGETQGGKKVEHVLEDGRRVVVYGNGTRKEVFPEGDSVIHFVNGDNKQILSDGRVVYYYAEARTTQTTHPDGLEEFEFVDGQREKHHTDGTQEIFFPDGAVKFIAADGREETHFADGSVEVVEPE